jgi:branched-chain amino acid transport system permease protein
MVEYIGSILGFVLIFGLAAMAYDLLGHYGGVNWLAQASFVGVGAYTSAILTTTYHWEFLPAMFAAMIIAAAFGAILAIILARLTAEYMMVGSVGFVFAFQAFLVNYIPLTNGTLGILGVPSPQFFGFVVKGTYPFLIIAAIICCILYFLARRLSKSPFGRTLVAMRDDEIATTALGKNLLSVRVSVFIIASVMAAVAGCMYAQYVHYVDPYHYGLHDTFNLIVMCIVGGSMTLHGPFLGALIMTAIPEIFRFFGFPSALMAPFQNIFSGLVLILIAMFWPNGLMGKKVESIKKKPRNVEVKHATS